MSIEFKIFMRFPEIKDPVERFLEIAVRFETEQRYGSLFRLEVDDLAVPKYQAPQTRKEKKRGGYDRPPLLELPSDRDEPVAIPLEQLHNLLRSFHGETLWVEGWWEVFREEDRSGEVQTDRIILRTQGTYLHHPSLPDGGVIYEAGTNHTIKSRKHSDAMAEETRIFVELGAEEMVGWNGNQTSDLRTSFLCYHRNLDEYCVDLLRPSESPRYPSATASELLRPITQDDILNAYLYCEDDETHILETAAGPIVYDPDIWGGLGPFYTSLYNTVRARS